MRVVDASAALKWVLTEEEGHQKALALISEHAVNERPIIVPDLLFYEITNVLAFVVKLTEAQINELLDWLYQLDLRIATLGRDDFKAAARIAQDYHITVYDASYVALAMSLKASLVTADKELIERLKHSHLKIEAIV